MTGYDEDFYTWTQEQAAALRRARPNSVDWENLAEEIEDMGNATLSEIEGLVTQIIAHLLKLEHSSAVDPRRKWMREITAFRIAVSRRAKRSKSALRRIDLEDLYEDALRLTDGDSEDDGWPVRPIACPWTLEEVLRDGWYPEGPQR